MISDQARQQFLKAINEAVEDLKYEYDISQLTDLKVHINISKSHDPEISTMVIMSRTDQLHIENGKIIGSQADPNK